MSYFGHVQHAGRFSRLHKASFQCITVRIRMRSNLVVCYRVAVKKKKKFCIIFGLPGEKQCATDRSWNDTNFGVPTFVHKALCISNLFLFLLSKLEWDPGFALGISAAISKWWFSFFQHDNFFFYFFSAEMF